MRLWAVVLASLVLAGATGCASKKAAVKEQPVAVSEPVKAEPTPEQKAAEEAAKKKVRLDFVPTVGMRRADIETVIGPPEFTGFSKDGAPFSMYPMESNFRTIVYDRDGQAVSWDPQGPIAPLAPAAPQPPN